MGERKDHHRDKWVNKGTAHSLKIAKASRGGWEREEKRKAGTKRGPGNIRGRRQEHTGQHESPYRGNHTRGVHERHPRTEQENSPYGARRSNLDRSLKEATLGDCFIARGREFQYLGAMLLIDLGSERLTKKLLLAPLVA